MSWYRAYPGMAGDAKFGVVAAKVGCSSGDVLQVWVLCMEYMCERGNLEMLDIAEAAVAIRQPEEQVTAILHCFRDRGMADAVSLSAWNKRQYKSDVSTERVKQHRANMKRPPTVSETPPQQVETAPDTDTDTDSEQSPPIPSGSAPRKRRPGTHLPDDWSPTLDERRLALAKGFSPEQVGDMAAAFRVHWTTGNGRNKTHADWRAAWRVWVSKEKTHAPNRNNPARHDRPRTIIEALDRKERAELEALGGSDLDAGDGAAAPRIDRGTGSGAGGGLRQVAGPQVRPGFAGGDRPEIGGDERGDGAVDGVPAAQGALRSDGHGAISQERADGRIVGLEGRQAHSTARGLPGQKTPRVTDETEIAIGLAEGHAR